MGQIALPKSKLHDQKVGFFRFRELKGKKILLTNECGEYIILRPGEFKAFLNGAIRERHPLYPVLQEQGLIRDKTDFPSIVSGYGKKNLFLRQGPSLHIMVLTLRCDHKCVYCQASSRGLSEKNYDMSLETAKKAVDIIFKSPSPSLAIEFQGGEPLVNWPAVKFVVTYALEKNKILKKDLELRLVSNFTMMDKSRLDFLAKNKVTLCTSLDGPEKLHNKNRIWTGGNSYRQTVRWLKAAQKVYKGRLENIFRPGAVVTISLLSLKYADEIVREYLRLGIEAIFVRPMTPLGVAREQWKRIGYSADQYLAFYKKLLDQIISYNLKNPKTRFHEHYAKIMLGKILTEYDPNYLELRSPCGAGIGQLLYNYDGRVYTCDEGRMVGEDTFCLGDVRRNSYRDLVSHPTVKSLCLASCLEGLSCDSCAYKSYCGVCPIYNYAVFGNIFSPMTVNERCRINKGIFDYLFEKIQNGRIRDVFMKWAQYTLPDQTGKRGIGPRQS